MSFTFFEMITFFGNPEDIRNFKETFKLKLNGLGEVIKEGREYLYYDTLEDTTYIIQYLSKQYPNMWIYLAVDPESKHGVWEITFFNGEIVKDLFYSFLHPDYENLADSIWKPYRDLKNEDN